MIDLNYLDESFARLRQLAEANQETGTFEIEHFHDCYEVPGEGEWNNLVEGDKEFIFTFKFPRTDLPAGAVKVPRIPKHISNLEEEE